MAGFSILSTRYSQALLSLTEEKATTPIVETDMAAIKAVFAESKELRSFFNSPVININTKKAIVEKVFKAKVSETTLLFLEKLCEYRREKYIGEIAELYLFACKKLRGVVSVKVTSAATINDKIRAEVTQIIKNNKEFIDVKSIDIEEKIDKGIIGGIIITVGDKQVDASFSRMIAEYKMAFSKNLYVKEF